MPEEARFTSAFKQRPQRDPRAEVANDEDTALYHVARTPRLLTKLYHQRCKEVRSEAAQKNIPDDMTQLAKIKRAIDVDAVTEGADVCKKYPDPR